MLNHNASGRLVPCHVHDPNRASPCWSELATTVCLDGPSEHFSTHKASCHDLSPVKVCVQRIVLLSQGQLGQCCNAQEHATFNHLEMDA